jgi:hypothetical protein
MRDLKRHRAFGFALFVAAACLVLRAQSIEITPLTILEEHNVTTKPVEYRGRRAIEVRDAASQLGDDTPRMVLMKDIALRDGTIEISLAGDTAVDAPASFRGFVGIAFRIGPDRSRYECIYLRPKNGRASDPVQRGHSAQYESMPEFPWDRLRAEAPGKYESYVDLSPGEWTRVRIQITGKRALLFVNDAKEPTLVVNDLKGTVEKGPVALWIGPGTIAHFTDLKVIKE